MDRKSKQIDCGDMIVDYFGQPEYRDNKVIRNEEGMVLTQQKITRVRIYQRDEQGKLNQVEFSFRDIEWLIENLTTGEPYYDCE
jgi:hypothetical protein